MLDIEIPVSEIVDEQEKPTETYRLDLSSGHISGKVDGIEAVKQATDKILRTPRYKSLIYDSDYGSELQQLLYGENVTRELIETAFPQMIREALMEDTRILEVENFAFEFKESAVHISFTVSTIFGKTDIEKEVENA